MQAVEKTGVTEIVDPTITKEYLIDVIESLDDVNPIKTVLSAYANRMDIRFLTADEWIEQHASGTLRKNKRLGFAWQDQYIAERIPYEYGWCFECVPASRVMWGRPYTEGDCHAITESGWHIERYFELKFFPEDIFEAKYLMVEYADGTTKEGVGIVIRQTSAKWVGQGKLVFAIVAEYDKETGKWLEASNPF